MLRKFSHIILSTLLFVSTMGMVLSKHYCGDSFISTTFYLQAKSCCGDSDCCHDVTHVYQVKEDFSAPVVLGAPVLAELNILGHDLLLTDCLTAKEKGNTILSFDNSPPPPNIQKVLFLKQLYLL